METNKKMVKIEYEVIKQEYVLKTTTQYFEKMIEVEDKELNILNKEKENKKIQNITQIQELINHNGYEMKTNPNETSYESITKINEDLLNQKEPKNIINAITEVNVLEKFEKKDYVATLVFDFAKYKGMIYKYELIYNATAKVEVNLDKQEFEELYDMLFSEDEDKEELTLNQKYIKIEEYFANGDVYESEEIFLKFSSIEDALIIARNEGDCSLEDTEYRDLDEEEDEEFEIEDINIEAWFNVNYNEREEEEEE